MALKVNSITAHFAKLSLGISRTSIRYNQTAAVIDAAREKEIARQKEIAKSTHAEGHGLNIWVFFHILDGFTVLQHTPIMKATAALRQISFNGRKLQPSKFRKDYWQTLAMIGFPNGYEQVGRSVYQLLREVKTLHQQTWDDDMFYTSDEVKKKLFPRSKRERGRRLNDMKTTTIADMAAVLGGLGKGNKIWQPLTEDPIQLLNLDAEDEKNLKRDEDGLKARVKANIWWLDDLDRNYAESWPSNVTHHRFDRSDVKGWFNYQPSPAENPVDKPVVEEVVEDKTQAEGEEGAQVVVQEGFQEGAQEKAQEKAQEEGTEKTSEEEPSKEKEEKEETEKDKKLP
ncbi:transcriptional regulation of mitochondrial recombination-domain-containing protein [Annulohypoxylon stygium]|nr:transcriptional regulation of mitochondrial recombination-domain-containing protein [Annulohypoxylon stygium]